MNVIITTSGTGSRLGEITNFTNKSLVKLGDKFAIDCIIDCYNHLKNVNFIITLGYKGDLVKQYLTICYPDIKFIFVNIDKYEGVGSSLIYSLLQAKSFLSKPFYFHCCDTIIFKKLSGETDNKVYVYKSEKASNYSSIKVKGSKVVNFFNKGELNYDFVYIGLAYIKDTDKFWNNLELIYKNNKNNSSLSDIHVYMEMLKQKIDILYENINEYYDMGTVSNYFEADKCLEKKYNVLFKIKESISFHDNKVIKFFADEKINKNRLRREKFIPNTPRILNTSKNFHSMELIDSKPLSEIYKHGLIKKLLEWSYENLWIFVKLDNFEDICKKFYFDKTKKRINDYNAKQLADYEIINGLNIGRIDELLNKIDFNILYNSKASRFHGDFILDNILLKDEKFILIDWRQDFGDSIEGGDMYYDLAKLRHNIILNHRNIEKKLFTIDMISDKECVLDLKCNYFLTNQLEEYESFINDKKINMKKIKILTSLIWINMAPLHEYPLSEFLFNFGKYNLALIMKKYKI